jgi:hypothetical protein
MQPQQAGLEFSTFADATHVAPQYRGALRSVIGVEQDSAVHLT